jgi:hypothetical protein
MSMTERAELIPLDHRQAIFLAVVEAQDRGAAVVKARTEVASKFNVSVEVVKVIEREGLDNNWPPL